MLPIWWIDRMILVRHAVTQNHLLLCYFRTTFDSPRIFAADCTLGTDLRAEPEIRSGEILINLFCEFGLTFQ